MKTEQGISSVSIIITTPEPINLLTTFEQWGSYASLLRAHRLSINKALPLVSIQNMEDINSETHVNYLMIQTTRCYFVKFDTCCKLECDLSYSYQCMVILYLYDAPVFPDYLLVYYYCNGPLIVDRMFQLCFLSLLGYDLVYPTTTHLFFCWYLEYIYRLKLVTLFMQTFEHKEFNSFAELKKYKGMKIIQLNCCSIINNIDSVRCQILQDNSVDVCCLCETWLTDRHVNSFYQIDGYQMERSDSVGSDSFLMYMVEIY